MGELSTSLSWPAAQRTGSILVQHPAWEEARNAVLDLAAEGPVTVFLTGPPGSGKTWLLRELAACLGDHGFPTMVLLRGDLPVPLSNGAAVLIDEASYMPDRTRTQLAAQDRGVVVLADVAPFPVTSTGVGFAPVLIELRLLTAHEVGPFAAEWLRQEGLSPSILDPAGLSRLIAHSGGAVRLAAHLLAASVALTRATGNIQLTASVVDQAAWLRLGASGPDQSTEPHAVVSTQAASIAPADEPLEYPVFPHSPVLDPSVKIVQTLADWEPTDRTGYRWLLAGAALAACAAAVAFVPGLLHRAPAPTPSGLPALQSAGITPPDVASTSPPAVSAQLTAPTQANPVLADRVAPAPVPSLARDTLPNAEPARPAILAASPPLQAATVPLVSVARVSEAAQPSPAALPSAPVTPAPVSDPILAQAPAPLLTAMAQPVASVPVPSTIQPVAAASAATVPSLSRRNAAGLVLVAQRGDTLERLYDNIYRDRHAPPFSEILAANPRPFKPGAIVVFPEPIGGWARLKR